MSYPAKINILEVAPRDGLQIEPVVLTVEQKLRLINDLVAAGVRDIEVGSFVKPDKVPTLADTPAVVAGLPVRPDVKYRVLAMNAAGINKAMRDPKIFKEALVYTAPSDTFMMRNVNRNVEQSFEEMNRFLDIYDELDLKADTLALMAVWGCNYEGDIDPARVMTIIERTERLLVERGHKFEILRLADTMGWATPFTVKRMVGMIQDRWPEIDITMHFHDSRGAGLANIVASMEMGVTEIDSSAAGTGGCPFTNGRGVAGNVATEELVFLCNEAGVETGIDLEHVIEIGRWLEDVLQRPLPGKVKAAGSLEKYRQARNAAQMA